MDYKLEYKPVGFGTDPATNEENQGITGTFFIPAYQRGYRWTRDEVHKLLNDLSEAARNKIDHYSLQPIVVKRRGEGDWELIDGQQRLTTLWLIFDYMYRSGYRDFRACYQLEYETRSLSRDYLQTLDEQQARKNIDFFHLRAAHEAIAEWFETIGGNIQGKGSRITRIYTYLWDSVRVIWYEVPEEEEPIPLFTRLNQGRIPLTDAELLKAVLLNAVAKNKPGRETEIAAQWDGIERDLQRPEIWAFAAGGIQDDGRYGTRISLLFDTLAQEKSPTAGMPPRYHTFDTLRAEAESESLALWKEIVTLHAQILGWFEEPKLYNKIGFLVTCGLSISVIQQHARQKNKGAFDQWLTDEIRRTLNVRAEALDEDLRYDSRDGNATLQRLLLLFNIDICSDRFPFEKHTSKSWTLEHIHAQDAQKLNRAEEWKSWLEEHHKALQVIQEVGNRDDVARLLGEVSAAINAVHDRGFGDRFDSLAGRVLQMLTPDDEGTDHTIANLALLSHGDNAALSNSVFEVKRQKILHMDKEGAYIPAATRNVFLKYYTTVGHLQSHFWGLADKEAYRVTIKKQLKAYLQ